MNEFIDFTHLADRLGFRRLSFALNLHGWGQEKYLAENLQNTIDDSLTYDLAMEAVDIGKQSGIELSFWDNISKYSTQEPKSLCPWPFERAYISSDMRVVPCCMIANPDIFDLGDARSFKDIWHSDQYNKFRAMHLNGDIPKPCQPCYSQ